MQGGGQPTTAVLGGLGVGEWVVKWCERELGEEMDYMLAMAKYYCRGLGRILIVDLVSVLGR